MATGYSQFWLAITQTVKLHCYFFVTGNLYNIWLLYAQSEGPNICSAINAHTSCSISSEYAN